MARRSSVGSTDWQFWSSQGWPGDPRRRDQQIDDLRLPSLNARILVDLPRLFIYNWPDGDIWVFWR